MKTRSFLLLLLLSGSVFASQAPAPSPSPEPVHRHRIADIEHAGPTVADRHPWIQRIENFIQFSLMIALSLGGGHR